MPKSVSQAVAEVLQLATEPPTIAEIVQGIDLGSAPRPRRPEVAVRSALFENPLITTLGGRPARYVWWPARLAGSSFRQPLARMKPDTGGLTTM